ncbi:hypothetical protein [Kineothrix sp. MB12-C1]|uniref:hypothetical protein n=1 Tax=Kineothrix sp. MB12-C1 TaxID=3070215 RepID=UPI0027D21304|nr:hypothetical protein [Kineothrix sp. MB12-C1]WMC94211.1 hypothetical protein RBB56_08130 [Kineothrix sp. MB12-C1]
MLDTYILSGIDYRACAYSVFGEPVTFIGYPTSEGNGNLINSLWSIAISSNSEYKDAAWELISNLLSEDIQEKIEQDLSSLGFLLRKDSLEKHFISAKKW